MPCYVFRFAAGGTCELLHFDGLALQPLLPPSDWPAGQPCAVSWGDRSPGSTAVALVLSAHCGVPYELVTAVAALLAREWVAQLQKSAHTIPAWIVQQEVVRLTMRVFNDLNGN